MNPQIVLAITGASGAAYAVRLLEVLLDAACDVHLLISPAGRAVLKQELNLAVDLEHFQVGSLLPDPKLPPFGGGPQAPSAQAGIAGAAGNLPGATEKQPGKILYHHYMNLLAPVASGSFLTAGMVVCPCSGGTLSGIAHGASNNLIQRAADVHLKERRRLIVVPRETPLSTIQLDNMKRCAEAGAVVLPAMPGFYHGAKSIRDLVDFVVARICDQLGVDHCLVRRWGE